MAERPASVCPTSICSTNIGHFHVCCSDGEFFHWRMRAPALHLCKATQATSRMSKAPTSSSTTSLGFGIVGVGMIADFHAQAIAQTNGGKLVGVATRNLENASAFARKHHVPFA